MQTKAVKVKELQDIKGFDINDDVLLYVTQLKNTFSICSLAGTLQNEYKTSEDEEYYETMHAESDGFIWINCKKKGGRGIYTLGFTGNQVKKMEPIFSTYLPDDHSSYRIIRNDKGGYLPQFYQKLDANQNKVWTIETLKFGLFHVTEEYACFKNATNLFLYNNQTGEALWTYTLPDKAFDYIPTLDKKFSSAQIQKILGVYQQNVWLLISNGSVIALDLKTGQQTAHLFRPVLAEGFTKEQITYFTERMDNKKSGLLNSSLNTHLDTETGTIFGFSYIGYGEIDLTDPSYPFSFWNIKPTLASQVEEGEAKFDSLRVGCWEKNHVYVFPWASNSNRFGVFDRNTRTMLWSERFDGVNDWGAIKDLKYSNGYLYLHGMADNSLHIYQLNENSK